MAAMRYLFYPHPTIFAFSSPLLLNLFFHKCHWLAIISKSQTKKLNNNETLNVSLQFYLSVTLIHYVLLFTIMISCLLFQYLLFTSYFPMPHLCKGPELLSSTSGEAKLLWTLIIIDWGISLPNLPSRIRINLKLHKILVTL